MGDSRMAQKRITVTEDSTLQATKLEQSPTIWRSWMFPHTHLLLALKNQQVQKDLNKCGVYILVTDKNDGQYDVYVGESENIASRLRQHYDKPPFQWDNAMVFISSDEYLEKSHIRYLEQAIYKRLSASPKARLQNGNAPGGAHVNDKETLDDFIETIATFTVRYGFRGLFDNRTPVPAVATQPLKVPSVPATATFKEEDVPHKIGVIMKTAFRKALADGRLSEADISELLDKKSADTFKMNKKLPLLVAGSLTPEFKVRYYKESVSVRGKTYYISKEFLARSKMIVLTYLTAHGMTIDEINKACSETQSLMQNKRKQRQSQTSNAPSTKHNTPSSSEEPPAFPHKVGRVMLFAFSEALHRGLFKPRDIKFLLSAEAGRAFKTRGYPVLAPESYPRIDQHGINRFAKQTVECNGKRFLVTTQVYREGLPAILSYLNQHGMSNDDVVKLCEQGEKKLQDARKKK
jgi:hypothetical protein